MGKLKLVLDPREKRDCDLNLMKKSKNPSNNQFLEPESFGTRFTTKQAFWKEPGQHQRLKSALGSSVDEVLSCRRNRCLLESGMVFAEY